jgi:predicted ArsR family transcriptional regulator
LPWKIERRGEEAFDLNQCELTGVAAAECRGDLDHQQANQVLDAEADRIEQGLSTAVAHPG